jgi:hypothetical protein
MELPVKPYAKFFDKFLYVFKRRGPVLPDNDIVSPEISRSRLKCVSNIVANHAMKLFNQFTGY